MLQPTRVNTEAATRYPRFPKSACLLRYHRESHIISHLQQRVSRSSGITPKVPFSQFLRESSMSASKRHQPQRSPWTETWRSPSDEDPAPLVLWSRSAQLIGAVITAVCTSSETRVYDFSGREFVGKNCKSSQARRCTISYTTNTINIIALFYKLFKLFKNISKRSFEKIEKSSRPGLHLSPSTKNAVDPKHARPDEQTWHILRYGRKPTSVRSSLARSRMYRNSPPRAGSTRGAITARYTIPTMPSGTPM